MLGFVGTTFIGERMFEVIARVKDTNDYFELTDYLIYQDMVYYGTETEKNKISF